MRPRTSPPLLLTAVTLAAIAACDMHDPSSPTPETLDPPATARFGRADHVVRPGESIQDAVDAAQPGAVIHIEPGVYAQAIAVDKPGIKLIGRRGRRGAGVVIENPGEENNGIRVGDGGDGFALVNVHVRGFESNGVILIRVDGFLLSHVSTEDNGAYGLFPVRSSNGVIQFSSAVGHADAGIYVGLSENVVVRHSRASANVLGIEIENSTNVKVFRNDAYDNTAGIVIILLPGLPVNTSADIWVAGNRVRDNNRENFAEEGELVAAVPSGSGILVIGSDRVIVEKNRVHANDFVGIALGSSLLIGAIAGVPPEAFADIEPNPDGARVLKNNLRRNGAAPPPELGLPGVDLFWDASGTDNCWEKNKFETSFPDPLPSCE